MPLTATAIRHAKPGKKTKKMFDGGGLYLEISPRGGKWWRLKYRFAGKEKRISLGVYPDVPLREARHRRAQARQLLAREIDPSQHRMVQRAAKRESSANGFEAVAREWFAKHSPIWANSHSRRVLSRLERDIFPWIGGKPKDVLPTSATLGPFPVACPTGCTRPSCAGTATSDSVSWQW